MRLPCYAAALGVVGWYLLLPPLKPKGPVSNPNTRVGADTQIPFSKWTAIAEFKTEEECKAFPDHLLKLLHKSNNPPAEENRGAESAGQYWFSFAECIRNDDPRVAGVKPPAK
jgi:hypothetical protein